MVASTFRGLAAQHPCIGARSVMTNGNFYFTVIANMSSVESALQVVQVIEKYLAVSDSIDDPVKTLAIFFTDTFSDVAAFATQYWKFVQRVHDIDMMCNGWDSSVSSDPKSPSFELSIAGRAIFTTTLNPAHPRPARRAPYPTWVCNQTRQFNQLREAGTFETWKASIRKADAEVDPSGSANPLLVDHGYSSAAQQLAGWPIDPCPLVVRNTLDEKIAAARAAIAGASGGSSSEATMEELGRRLAVLVASAPTA